MNLSLKSEYGKAIAGWGDLKSEYGKAIAGCGERLLSLLYATPSTTPDPSTRYFIFFPVECRPVAFIVSSVPVPFREIKFS